MRGWRRARIKSAAMYRFLQVAFGPAVRTIWRMRIEGHDRVPQDGPVIVAANHNALTDPFFLAAAFDRQLRYLAKAELWRSRRVRWFMNATRCIPIERGRGDQAAMNNAVRALEAGDSIGIFPQGTILGSPQRPWLSGAARLALATGAPIQPVALINTEKAEWPRLIAVPTPIIAVKIGNLIRPDGKPASAAAAKDLMEQVRMSVESMLSSALSSAVGPVEHSNQFPAASGGGVTSIEREKD